MPIKDISRVMEYKDAKLTVKADGGDADYLTVSGYGSVFGNVDSHGDIIVKGAFADTITGRKPKMLWQHDPDMPIGVWDDIKEDENGLFMSGRISRKATKGAEIASLVEMGAIEGLSIGYRTKEYEVDTESDVRTLTKLDLWETSVVTFPSNELANIYQMKAADMTKRDLERVFKDLGYSGTEAKAMSGGAWDRLDNVLREAGVPGREDDQREVDELKKLLTETLQQMETKNV